MVKKSNHILLSMSNIVNYVLINLLSMYIISFKSYQNEYNYISQTKDLNLSYYLIRRLICGRYCLFIPVMDPNTKFYKREQILSWYSLGIFILLFMIIPIFVFYIINILKNTKRKRKKKIYNFVKIVIQILLFIIFIYSLLI